MKKIIFIQQIGYIDHIILLNLKNELKNYFGENKLSVKLSDKIIPLDDFKFESTSMKYNGSEILNALSNYFNKSKFLIIIGIVNGDIKSLKRNYVFGIARTINQLSLADDGIPNKPRLALISLLRLRENFYFRPENDSLFQKRLLKIAIHEIGHLLGLKRCNNDCIMKCKYTITQVDMKPFYFCEKCQDYLQSLFRRLK